jgi:hypothetical protein
MIPGFSAGASRALRRFALASACLSMASGCAGRSALQFDLVDAGADADSGPVEDSGPPPLETSDKLDLLLVVDNSRDLETAHALLADTVEYLLQRLVNPPCVNGLGNVVAEPALPSEACPVGKRDFAPIRDFHVGVISTSLGGHGADVCSPASPNFKPPNNDAAHLLRRNNAAGVVPTYANLGFLAWDPAQASSPPGDGNIATLGAKLVEIVRGVGTNGCGFESQLESIHRFLVDPDPPMEITIQNGAATPIGVDAIVLQQRADFLRPDSLVAVLLVTDENDCSTRESGQYYLSNQGLGADNQPFHLPRARSECALDTADPCCASCGQKTPAGCSPTESDPQCLAPSMTSVEDPLNLRCFDQKRRFGVDFLYPLDRYIEGLTEPSLATRDGQIVDNPLFASGRSNKLVTVTGVIGVPWQDIANNPGTLTSGYLQASLVDWSLLLPDPSTGAPPLDPLMVESILPRSGVNPPTGAALAGPDSLDALANPVNGHERNIVEADDLQYACIYPLPEPKTCSDATCDCSEPESIQTNPLCQQIDGSYTNVQRFARALPATRELALLRALGDQGAVASICAPVVTGPAQPAFGYRPAVDALMRTLRRHIE